MGDLIIKNGVRILRPSEFNKLITVIPKHNHQVIIKTLLFTGMRFTEIQRLKQNPDWLFNDSKYIHLPNGASLKLKAKQKDRHVSLSPWGYDIVKSFLNNGIHLPTRQTLDENLKRWGEKSAIDSKGLCLKTFRKTIESWLITIYPEQTLKICLRQGHTETTSLKHYLNLPFNESDRIEMRQFVQGMQW